MPQKKKSTVSKRADAAKKRYGKTMTGVGGKAKPSVKTKITRSGLKPTGFKTTIKF